LRTFDRIFGADGAHEAILAAQKAGKIRFVGFTGHKDPQVHLRMLEVADRHEFHFDTAQMPINVMDAHFRSFRKTVVPELLKREIALLGMKPIANGAILKSKTVTAPECLRFALSQPTSVVITGIDRPEILKQALTVVKEFKPLTADEEKDLLSRTAKSAADGHFERFKTSNEYDSSAKHPEWLG
jgi:predicted aldo/keto reductase-like oxidoreductase